MNVKINPERRTKIAEGSCTVRAKNNTYIINITDEDNNVLASTYANNSQEIKSDKTVYAESTKYPMEIEVTGSVVKPVEKSSVKNTATTDTTSNKKNPKVTKSKAKE